VHVTTDLSHSEILIAGWRTSHLHHSLLHGSYNHMSDQPNTASNTASPRAYYVGITDTRTRRQLTAVQVAALLAAGATFPGTDPRGIITGNLFASPAPDGTVYCLPFDRWYDPSLYNGDAANALAAFQADPNLASGAITEAPQWWTDPAPAASPAPTAPAASASASSTTSSTSTSEPTPAAVTQTASTTDGTSGSAPAAPTTGAPARVLSPDEHAHSRSLLQRIEAEVHHLSDDAQDAFAILVALLHHA